MYAFHIRQAASDELLSLLLDSLKALFTHADSANTLRNDFVEALVLIKCQSAAESLTGEGRDGPVSGQALLEARPVAGGGWQQSGPDEWKWFSDAGEEFDEAPAGWPRRITVCDGPGMELVAAFAEQDVATEGELIALLRSVTSGQQHRILPCVSASSRLATAQFVYPDFFGELDCPSKGSH